MPDYDVAIVGGGISGLAAAFEIQRRTVNGRPLKSIVLESAHRFGGKIGTDIVDGFMVEQGPDTFLASKPAGLQLCQELGLADQVIPTQSETRGAYLSRRGSLFPLPSGMSGLVPGTVRGLLASELLTKTARVRASFERFVPSKRNGADESVFAFASRRYGNQVAEQLIEPLLAGIYAGDGRSLSARAAIPQLCTMESRFGSVSRGLAKRAAKSNQNGHASVFVSLANGMGTLVQSLLNQLKTVDLRLSTTVSDVVRRDDRWLVRAGVDDILAKVVIFATPSYAAAQILASTSPDLSAELSAIRFVSTATVAMGFTPAPPRVPRRGHGYIVPRTEDTLTTACTWSTLKLPNRAPGGSFLARVFLGRDGKDDVVARTDAELEALSKTELKRTLGIVEPPTTVRVHRHEHAMPQYELGHLQRLARIDQLLQNHAGLYFAGCSYRGVGIPDCISSGRLAGMHAVGSFGD